MDNSNEIVPPHLNAEIYRTDTTGTNTISYLEYIRIHSGMYLFFSNTLVCERRKEQFLSCLYLKETFWRDLKFVTDGSVLVGSSELTGRYWNGGVSVYKGIANARCVQNEEKRSIPLSTGTTDGCFIGSSTKVCCRNFCL